MCEHMSLIVELLKLATRRTQRDAINLTTGLVNLDIEQEQLLALVVTTRFDTKVQRTHLRELLANWILIGAN